VFTLKRNTELFEKSSSGFRDLVKQITTKTFSGKQSDHQCHISFVIKKAAKMVSKHKHNYLVNSTMQEELNFILHTLSPDSKIMFENPIALLIPRIPK
jgi:hypothetical protein